MNIVNTGQDTVFTHPVHRSVIPFVYMMITHNSNDVIASTATPAITFPSLLSFL